jgi:hypothetical protein
MDARAPGSGARPSGWGAGGATASGGGGAGGEGTGAAVGDPACAEMERADIFQRFGSSPCPKCIQQPIYGPYGVTIDAQGNAVDLITHDGSPIPDDLRSCYLNALGGTKFPCLSGEDIWYECVTLLR